MFRRRYELFYYTGGHGGPYHTLAGAISWAKRLLKNSPTERTIFVRPYSHQGYDAPVRTVRKDIWTGKIIVTK